MTYPIKAARQNMDQKPPDKLVRLQAHAFVALAPLDLIVLPLEGERFLIGTDQLSVGDRDPMRATRQVGQHRFRPCKGLLGIDTQSMPRVGCR